MGIVLALAYPDRLALPRAQERPGVMVLSSGRGAALEPQDPLAASEALVAAHLDGDRRQARIWLAAPLPRAALELLQPEQLLDDDVVEWDDERQQVMARRQRRLGALLLSDAPQPRPDAEAVQAVLLEQLQRRGLEWLGWSPAQLQLRGRLAFLHQLEPELWPAVDDASLLAELDLWLGPHLQGVRSATQLQAIDLQGALLDRLIGVPAANSMRWPRCVGPCPVAAMAALITAAKSRCSAAGSKTFLVCSRRRGWRVDAMPCWCICSHRRAVRLRSPAIWRVFGSRVTRWCAKTCGAVIPSTAGRRIQRRLEPAVKAGGALLGTEDAADPGAAAIALALTQIALVGSDQISRIVEIHASIEEVQQTIGFDLEGGCFIPKPLAALGIGKDELGAGNVLAEPHDQLLFLALLGGAAAAAEGGGKHQPYRLLQLDRRLRRLLASVFSPKSLSRPNKPSQRAV